MNDLYPVFDIEHLGKLLNEAEPLSIDIEPWRVYVLAALLQLALRHSELKDGKHPCAEVGMDMFRSFQEWLREIHPDIAQSFEIGWYSYLDVPQTMSIDLAVILGSLHYDSYYYDNDVDGNDYEGVE